MISTKNIVFFNFIKDGVNNFWNQTWLNIVIKVEKLSFRIKVSDILNYDFYIIYGKMLLISKS